jgi:predicted nuclease of predicted toxin-antitoxin system
MPDSPGLETLFVRLYFDRHIMTRLAIDLRGRGFDVLTTEEAGQDTASDEEQLVFATKESRAILTFTLRDFAPLHEQWQTAGRAHAGIIVSQQLGGRQYGLLLQRMLRLLNHFTAEEMISNVVHLEQYKQENPP